MIIVLDELLLSAYEVSKLLLPILGVIVLFFLAVFFRKLIKLIELIMLDIKGLDKTVDLVNQSIEKAQKPLDTAVKFSGSLDNMHDKSVTALKNVVDYASNNVDNIKDYISGVKKESKE